MCLLLEPFPLFLQRDWGLSLRDSSVGRFLSKRSFESFYEPLVPVKSTVSFFLFDRGTPLPHPIRSLSSFPLLPSATQHNPAQPSRTQQSPAEPQLSNQASGSSTSAIHKDLFQRAQTHNPASRTYRHMPQRPLKLHTTALTA